MLRKVVQLVDDPSMGKLDSMILKRDINILHCLQFSKTAWESVTAQTIQNCWRRAGFSLANSEIADNTTDDGEAATDSSHNSDLVELEKLDDAEPCHVSASSDIHEIVGMLQEESKAEDDEEEESFQQPVPPTSAAILQVVDTIRLALYASKADSSAHSSLSKVENYLSAKTASRLKQTRLDDNYVGGKMITMSNCFYMELLCFNYGFGITISK